jgi:proteic killer suppression protein
MVVSFRHKGLRVFYEKGDASKLQPQHIGKIRLIVTRLDAATTVSDMNAPGYRLHPLTGELRAFWSVKVDKNCRIVFRLVGEDIHDVDYLDYH